MGMWSDYNLEPKTGSFDELVLEKLKKDEEYAIQMYFSGELDKFHTPVAQLAEALGLEPKGCRFESDWGYQI